MSDITALKKPATLQHHHQLACCFAPPWPHSTACLQRSAGTKPVSWWSWSGQRAWRWPGRRLLSSPDQVNDSDDSDLTKKGVMCRSPEWAEPCGRILTNEVVWWGPWQEVSRCMMIPLCKATHALLCSWISMTAWWQHVCLCQERSNYIIGGTLPRRL